MLIIKNIRLNFNFERISIVRHCLNLSFTSEHDQTKFIGTPTESVKILGAAECVTPIFSAEEFTSYPAQVHVQLHINDPKTGLSSFADGNITLVKSEQIEHSTIFVTLVVAAVIGLLIFLAALIVLLLLVLRRSGNKWHQKPNKLVNRPSNATEMQVTK